jgi:outer membrane protein assembly factor BamA
MAKVLTYNFKGRAIALLILLLCFNGLVAQNNYQLLISSVDQDSSFLKGKLALKTSFSNKMQCQEYVQKLPAFLQAKGFIASSIDSMTVTDSNTLIKLFLGEHYEVGNIKVNDEDRIYLDQVVAKKVWNDGRLPFADYQLLQQKLLDYFENNGYPFAQVQLDSIAIKGKNIDAVVNVKKGILYKIDSIRLLGPAKISKNFVHRYLHIERGSIYRKEKLENINQRLLELPYLQQMQSWDMTMLSTGSIVNLYLQPKKSNQVNVLAGFLPNNQQTGGKLLFTVDANLQLKNAFGGGESVGLVWQQIQPKSPRLNLQYQQPYFFNSPFGVDFSFELYKKDSSFLNINTQVGLQYFLSEYQTGKVSIQSLRSNVLMTDTNTVKNFKRLPDIADVSSVNLGVDYDYNKTNYRYNPRSGNEFKIFVGAGNKKIRKSAAVTQIKEQSFNYNTLYDSVKLNTYQVRLKVQAAHYFPLGRQSVFKTGLNGGLYESPSSFKNELFQIGGYRLLRGFDEESIYASAYAVGTVEYRYLLGLNSYFSAFSDLGWSKDNSQKNPYSYKYIGAGVGLSFETKGGLFNISFANGKRRDLNFNIRQSKIHFGYVSVF